MTRITAIAAACLILGACSAMGVDKLGNEQPAFGVDTRVSATTRHYTAQSRSDLIVYCHDHDGYISTDGLNCAIRPDVMKHPDVPWCVEATVKGEQIDDVWLNSVCGGWRPAIQ